MDAFSAAGGGWICSVVSSLTRSTERFESRTVARLRRPVRKRSPTRSASFVAPGDHCVLAARATSTLPSSVSRKEALVSVLVAPGVWAERLAAQTNKEANPAILIFALRAFTGWSVERHIPGCSSAGYLRTVAMALPNTARDFAGSHSTR